MPVLSFPVHDLILEDRPDGIVVSQHDKTYLARKWQLTDMVQKIIRLAVDHRLTCLWQNGHPGTATSHHISFSFSHEPASWVFVLGGEAKPPKIKAITVSKKFRAILDDSGVGRFWESAGGKNFSISPESLPVFLRALEKSNLEELAKRPGSSSQQRIAAIAGIPSERYLEDCLIDALTAGANHTSGRIHRQRSFRAEHILHDHDRPDFIIETMTKTIVGELKLYQANQPEFAQLERYMGNREIKESFANRTIHGVLTAWDFPASVITQARSRLNCSLYAYTEKTVFPLRLIVGEDVFAPFFTG